VLTAGQARPLSPTKLKYPKLDFDRSTTEVGLPLLLTLQAMELINFQLQEDLHAAEMKVSEQTDEIYKLRMELEARPLKPNARIVELQEQVSGLQLIACKCQRGCVLPRTPNDLTACLIPIADYDRHLREPTRKVREDVEKEFSGKLASLERQLESKRIWAERLDENVRAVTAENRDLQNV
jgi:centromeric protein E